MSLVPTSAPPLPAPRTPARARALGVLGVALGAADAALLGRALRASNGRRGRALAAGAAVAGVAVVDLVAARRTARPRPDLELTAAVTIARSPKEVYDAWRGFERLPRVMAHLEQVEWLGPTLSRWTARAPFGRTVTWDAELVEDRPGEVIAWRSLPGGDVATSGEVRFTPAPGDRGTEVRARLRYSVPGGRAGELVARLAGEDPHQQVEDDLRRFKQVVETGDVVRSDGTPLGTTARQHLHQAPASPAGRKEDRS